MNDIFYVGLFQAFCMYIWIVLYGELVFDVLLFRDPTDRGSSIVVLIYTISMLACLIVGAIL